MFKTRSSRSRAIKVCYNCRAFLKASMGKISSPLSSRLCKTPAKTQSKCPVPWGSNGHFKAINSHLLDIRTLMGRCRTISVIHFKSKARQEIYLMRCPSKTATAARSPRWSPKSTPIGEVPFPPILRGDPRYRKISLPPIFSYQTHRSNS